MYPIHTRLHTCNPLLVPVVSLTYMQTPIHWQWLTLLLTPLSEVRHYSRNSTVLNVLQLKTVLRWTGPMQLTLAAHLWRGWQVFQECSSDLVQCMNHVRVHIWKKLLTYTHASHTHVCMSCRMHHVHLTSCTSCHVRHVTHVMSWTSHHVRHVMDVTYKQHLHIINKWRINPRRTFLWAFIMCVPSYCIDSFVVCVLLSAVLFPLQWHLSTQVHNIPETSFLLVWCISPSTHGRRVWLHL